MRRLGQNLDDAALDALIELRAPRVRARAETAAAALRDALRIDRDFGGGRSAARAPSLDHGSPSSTPTATAASTAPSSESALSKRLNRPDGGAAVRRRQFGGGRPRFVGSFPKVARAPLPHRRGALRRARRAARFFSRARKIARSAREARDGPQSCL